MSGFDGNGYRALAGGERVDHAAEARDHLVRADKQGAGDEVGADLRMSALVHATLALVEQQRIERPISDAPSDSGAAWTVPGTRPIPNRLCVPRWFGR